MHSNRLVLFLSLFFFSACSTAPLKSVTLFIEQLPDDDGPRPTELTDDIYFVDQNHPNANDSNDGTDPSAPWKSIDQAIISAGPGDFVYINAQADAESSLTAYQRANSHGLYPRIPGTADQIITFRNYPGQRVIIEGNGNNYGLMLTNASFHHFYGFVFKNFAKAADGNGFKENITIQNSEFTKTTEAGFKLRDSQHVLLQDVYIHHCFDVGLSIINGRDIELRRVESSFNDDGEGTEGDADGFHVMYGENILIIDSIARNNSEDGFDLTANAQLINVIAENNTAANIKLWRRDADDFAEKKVVIINSVIRNAGEAGIKISEGAQLFLYHSVVDHSTEEGIGFRSRKGHKLPAVRSEIINSIISNNGNQGVDLRDGNLLSANHNLYFQNPSHIKGYIPDTTSIIDRDPLFIAAEKGNYHLREDSPAVNAGVLLTSPQTKQDIDGDIRPIEDQVDIGIDEVSGK